MTIDEAIAHAREVAKENRKQHKTGCLGHIEEYYDAKQRAEEQEQLAEWLEELKEARKGFNENRKAGYKHGYSDGYNKAIDDFVKLSKEKWIEHDDLGLSSDFFDYMDEIAQQLKDGE